jgi:hypothetical protein
MGMIANVVATEVSCWGRRHEEKRHGLADLRRQTVQGRGEPICCWYVFPAITLTSLTRKIGEAKRFEVGHSRRTQSSPQLDDGLGIDGGAGLEDRKIYMTAATWEARASVVVLDLRIQRSI